ncbi:Crp/Fnr family transcriptional regulator [Muribaculaceae bacterium Isolate-013 (NCI)]|nr:Crp/Fnr family transcriptional regulator [Muribaculaceae bacterium Isolate-013 (NCI)]
MTGSPEIGVRPAALPRQFNINEMEKPGTMYETLLSMPLFKGVSADKISEIIGKYRFHFLKYHNGDVIVEAGEPCEKIRSVVSGCVRVTITNFDQRFRVSQTIAAPEVIAPDFFFGKTTSYPGTVTAKGDVGILELDKKDYLEIIISDRIFLFNFLNLLSMNAQLSVEGVLALTSGSLEMRIAYWIIALTDRTGSDIVMECRQRDMYTVFGVQRQSLIAALTRMRDDGLIDFTPNSIKVKDRRRLLELL